jgi:hypothetical protein
LEPQEDPSYQYKDFVEKKYLSMRNDFSKIVLAIVTITATLGTTMITIAPQLKIDNLEIFLSYLPTQLVAFAFVILFLFLILYLDRYKVAKREFSLQISLLLIQRDKEDLEKIYVGPLYGESVKLADSYARRTLLYTNDMLKGVKSAMRSLEIVDGKGRPQEPLTFHWRGVGTAQQ